MNKDYVKITTGEYLSLKALEKSVTENKPMFIRTAYSDSTPYYNVVEDFNVLLLEDNKLLGKENDKLRITSSELKRYTLYKIIKWWFKNKCFYVKFI